MKTIKKLIVIFVFFVLFFKIPRKAQADNVYQVTAVGAKILPTKINGKCWDFGCLRKTRQNLHHTTTVLAKAFGVVTWKAAIAGLGVNFIAGATYLPDPYAIIKIDGKRILQTSVFRDTLMPSWAETAWVRMNKNSSLEIYVYDKDIKHDDSIGYYSTATIHKRYITKGGVMRLRFGQVYQFELLIKPKQPLHTNHHLSQSIPQNTKTRRWIQIGTSGRYALDKKALIKRMKERIEKLPPERRGFASTMIGMIKGMTMFIDLGKGGNASMSLDVSMFGRRRQEVSVGNWKMSSNALLIYVEPQKRKNSRSARPQSLRCYVTGKRIACKNNSGKGRETMYFDKISNIAQVVKGFK